MSYDQISANIVPTICEFPGTEGKPRLSRIIKAENTSHYLGRREEPVRVGDERGCPDIFDTNSEHEG